MARVLKRRSEFSGGGPGAAMTWINAAAFAPAATMGATPSLASTMRDDPSVQLRLSFHGAAGTVTGSRYLLEADGARVLVDCGLFQGPKALRLRNREPLEVDPASLDAVLLTHAHLDHAGWVPRLWREGFRGPVWCTPATAALCGIMLPDAGRLQEEEAAYANAHHTSRHDPALPLYDESDARRCLALLRTVPFGDAFEAAPGVRASFHPQGHILGASAVLLEHAGGRLLFSGDVGRPHDPLMRAPAPPPACDWLVVESTYGDRIHPAGSVREELRAAVARALARQGVVVIPAFAVGRAQLVLHEVIELQAAGRLPQVPVYLNSPMASEVGALYQRFAGEHRLDPAQLSRLREQVIPIGSAEQSKALNRRHGPMVIVSASGMATGGRVLHHLVSFAPDPRNMILFAGFQAAGTRGAAMVRGDTHVRVFGQDVPVRAEVVQLDAGSAHADAAELLAWMRGLPRAPSRVFVTHGEPEASAALRARIERELGWSAEVPALGDDARLSLSARTAPAR